jgi:hypothetical protein
MLAFYLLTAAALASFAYFTSTLFASAAAASLTAPLVYAAAMMPAFFAAFGQARPFFICRCRRASTAAVRLSVAACSMLLRACRGYAMAGLPCKCLQACRAWQPRSSRGRPRDHGQHCCAREACVQPDGGWLWFAAALLPPSAMSLFAFALAAWTSAGVGVTFATFAKTLTPSPHFSVATIFTMLAFDFVLYGALTLLVDRWGGAAWTSDLLQRAFARRARWRGGAGARLLLSCLCRLWLRF